VIDIGILVFVFSNLFNVVSSFMMVCIDTWLFF